MAVKKWRGKWVVDFIVDGKRVRRVSPVQTKRGAKAYEVELRLELTSATPESGAAPAAEVPTLAEFATEWMSTSVRVHNKPSEQDRKSRTLRNHLVPFFGKRRLDQITQRDVETFRAQQLSQGLAVNTVNRHLAALARLMRCAVDWGVIREMPTIRMMRKQVEPTEWLRPDESERLLDATKAMNLRWFTFFYVALRTGLRKGEIFGLHWSEIDLERRRLTVRYTVWMGQLGTPKNGKSREVPIAADLVDVLSAWRERTPGELVFPSRKGQPVYGQAIANQALDRALKRAGLRRIRFHDLRHTFASQLVLRGCSLKVVQQLMGHHSVTMTERYAHVGDDQLVEAVQALVVDKGEDEST